jgi:hypothetical protein
LLSAHLATRIGRPNALAGSRLPRWLDRRLDWNRQSDLAELHSVERSAERPPVGKDARKDL